MRPSARICPWFPNRSTICGRCPVASFTRLCSRFSFWRFHVSVSPATQPSLQFAAPASAPRCRRPRYTSAWAGCRAAAAGAPLYIAGVGAFYSFDIQLQYDALQLSVIGVRRFDIARGAIVEFNAHVPGLVTIAFASAQPIQATTGAVLLVQFREHGSRVRRRAVRLVRGLVDDH